MGDHGNMLATKAIMVQQPFIQQFLLDAASNLQHSPTCHIFPKRKNITSSNMKLQSAGSLLSLA